MKWLANQWHSAGTWVWPRRVCWLMLAQWEDVKPLQVLFHCWTWSWHWRLSISRNTARQALYHRVGICYGQVQSRWKGAGGWRRLHLVEMELDLMAWLEHDWMKWRVHRPPLKCLRIVSHRCGLIVWWNSRWRQTQRNLSIRTATDGNVTHCCWYTDYERLRNHFGRHIIVNNQVSENCTYGKHFFASFCSWWCWRLLNLHDSPECGSRHSTQNFTWSESLTSPAGTAAPGRYVLWDVENPRCILQQPGVAPFAEKACFQGRSHDNPSPNKSKGRQLHALQPEDAVLVFLNWLAPVCTSLLVDFVSHVFLI